MFSLKFLLFKWFAHAAPRGAGRLYYHWARLHPGHPLFCHVLNYLPTRLNGRPDGCIPRSAAGTETCKALALLTDLKALAEREDNTDEFTTRFTARAHMHARTLSLIEPAGRGEVNFSIPGLREYLRDGAN